MNELEKLLNRYEIEYNRNDLITVLTHNSFSENNNSRYVFLGQFQFRGFVAQWIFDNIAGSGTQLQHFLGNIFSQNKLESYFDKWKISKTRQAENIDIQNQKHIFVYAYLGFIVDNGTKKQLKNFAFDQFIAVNDHLLPQVYVHKNHWDQLIFLCKQEFDTKPKIIFLEKEEKQIAVLVSLGNEILGEAQSVSFTYAKKKAIKTSLNVLICRLEEKVKNDPAYVANEKIKQEIALQKAQEERKNKQEKHLVRNKVHQEKMEVRRRQKEKEAIEQDKKRRVAKQIVKEKASRKGASTIYREYSAEEIAGMSVAKRRNLQDKGIIPKGI